MFDQIKLLDMVIVRDYFDRERTVKILWFTSYGFLAGERGNRNPAYVTRDNFVRIAAGN